MLLFILRRQSLCGERKSWKTHQALRSRVYHSNQQKADREPSLRVFPIKASERYDPQLLHYCYTGYTDERLDTEEQEIHVELGS